MEEADFVILNRIDELAREDVDRLVQVLAEHYPDTPLIRVSAKSGEGFEALQEFVAREGQFGQRAMEVDYDVYAEGEAELGWLNCQAEMRAAVPPARARRQR